MSYDNLQNNRKNNLLIYIAFAVAVTVCYSCSRSKLEEDVKQLMDKEISVPYDSMITYTNVSKTSIDSAEYKYIVYFDSLVCSTCTLKNMYYWEVIRDSVASLGKNVKFIFIYAPLKEETGKFLNDLKHAREKLISFVDTVGCFERNNAFIPENSNTHAFLLNHQNKVIMVGNAQYNPAIEELFFNLINKTYER